LAKPSRTERRIMPRIEKSGFIWIPKVMSFQFKIYIDGTDHTSDIFSAEFTRGLFGYENICKVVLFDGDGGFAGSLVGGEIIELFADYVDATTSVWKGTLEGNLHAVLAEVEKKERIVIDRQEASKLKLAEAYYKQGLSFYSHSNHSESKTFFEEAIRYDPNPEYYFFLGKAEYELGDKESAKEHFKIVGDAGHIKAQQNYEWMQNNP
jgi:hypothetical protein